MTTLRSCGSCTMCCRTMEVVELAKPPGKWCAHCAIGKGCTIYDERPPSCRTFECAWLQGTLPVELKPDLVRAVATADPQRGIVVLHLADGYDNLRKPLRRWLDGLADKGLTVKPTRDWRQIVVSGVFDVLGGAPRKAR